MDYIYVSKRTKITHAVWIKKSKDTNLTPKKNWQYLQYGAMWKCAIVNKSIFLCLQLFQLCSLIYNCVFRIKKIWKQYLTVVLLNSSPS